MATFRYFADIAGEAFELSKVRPDERLQTGGRQCPAA